MTCLTCGGATEDGTGGTYVRCTKCFAIFMNMNGALSPFPLDESTRAMMEQALGFKPSGPPPKFEAPKNCPQDQGALEIVDKEGEVFTRCTKCGLLSRQDGQFLMPVIVQAPTGGWDPEFQAIFEEQLGFIKRVRKSPPGVVGR